MSSFCGLKFHRGIGYIVTIGVIEGYRNQGLSSQLLEHMENYLKSEYMCDIILLNSSIENEYATFFYIHNNYEIILTKPGYYVYLLLLFIIIQQWDSKSHDAYYWRKYLSNSFYLEDLLPLSYLISNVYK